MVLNQQQAHAAKGKETLLHGKTFLVVLPTDSGCTTPLHCIQSTSSYICERHMTSHKKYQVHVPHSLQWVFDSQWQGGDIQLHLDIANIHGKKEKKSYYNILIFCMPWCCCYGKFLRFIQAIGNIIHKSYKW